MRKAQGFARRLILFAVLGVAGAALIAPSARPRESRLPSLNPTIGTVAAQLGVKINDRATEEFSLGVQFSGSLEDTLKLPRFGLKGFHLGSRVTVARIAQDRVHIEADELDPPRSVYVRVRIDATGKILPPATP